LSNAGTNAHENLNDVCSAACSLGVQIGWAWCMAHLAWAFGRDKPYLLGRKLQHMLKPLPMPQLSDTDDSDQEDKEAAGAAAVAGLVVGDDAAAAAAAAAGKATGKDFTCQLSGLSPTRRPARCC
jgi:hypothetical protein